MSNVALVLAFLSAGLGVLFTIMIVQEVSKRGVKINWFLIRLFMIKYIDQYKQLTRKETGKVGSLYYPCVGSYVAALIFAIIFLIAR
jgi:hypothetical protein